VRYLQKIEDGLRTDALNSVVAQPAAQAFQGHAPGIGLTGTGFDPRALQSV
jgi:hypothetical protein